MRLSLDSMLGSSILAKDGEIGKTYNVFFDDRSWEVRYLVVETGSWFTRRKVLISRAALGRAVWAEKTVPVLLTRQQVQDSPDVDADQPVSRQQELELARHYGWTQYVSLEPFPPFAWSSTPGATFDASEKAGYSHLRSAREIAGYHTDLGDGALGTVTDFIIDDDKWAIVDLVVKTDDHKVLIPTRWVSGISWTAQHVQLNQPLKRSMLEVTPG